MHENFITLKAEKRDAIMNAAMMEFSSKGFALASTNVIVSAAGISKGALFHYFKNKEDLFSFLCRYIFDIVVREYYEKIPRADGDLLGRLRDASRLKQQLFRRYPYIFEFVKRLVKEPPGILGEKATRQMHETMNLGYQKIMDGLNISLFKDEIPPEKVKELIFWSLEGYANRKMEQVDGITAGQLNEEEFERELEEYLIILRRCYYKKEVI